MNHETEVSPLKSTYYADTITLKLKLLGEFQQSQLEETTRIDRYTLVGFFFEIRKIAEEAIDNLMEDEE